MFFSEHRLKMTSLRIGKHRIVKRIALLRLMNIAHPSVSVIGQSGYKSSLTGSQHLVLMLSQKFPKLVQTICPSCLKIVPNFIQSGLKAVQILFIAVSK